MTIEEIKILIDSAVYLLCPGYITIVVWDILRGKKTREGKALFIKSIVTSSIYYYLFAWINGLEIKPSKMVDIKLYDYTIIILLSVFVPYVINKIISVC